MSYLSVDNNEVVEELLRVLVEKLEKKEFDLPPLPMVASQVLALTADPEADSLKLATLIQQDPILTAKVFQTSNSVAHGSHRRIDSIQQAITWLGLNTVAGRAFTLSVLSGVFNVRGYEREVKELWMHMLTTAFYAKTIAGLIGKNPDTAFLGGLLHAIGKPFVVHTVTNFQKDSTSPLPWTTLSTLIKESYMEAGRQLAEAWDFPDSAKEAINLHEDHAYLLGTSPTKCAPIIYLARQVASHFLDPGSISEETIWALPVVRTLKIQEDVMKALLEIHSEIQVQVEAMLI